MYLNTKKSIYILLGLAAIFFTKKLKAQTEPMYSQYMFNMLSVNPAYAGSREATSINFFQRRHWVGLKGSPQTTSVSIDGAINEKKIGLGLQMYEDKLGVEKANGLNTMISSRIRVSDVGVLSGGLTFGLMNYKIDLNSFIDKTYQKGDPVYYNNLNKFIPTVGTGLFYNTDKFYVGLALPSVIRPRQTDLDLVKSGIQKINKQQVFINSGVVLDVNEDVKLKPSFMLKMMSGAPISADINTNVWLKDFVGFGVSYRIDDAILALFELQISSSLRFGYAFDKTISPLKYYNNGSHELLLRYELINKKYKIKSTRHF